MTKRQLFIKARKLISDPRDWCTKYAAKTIIGMPISPHSPHAVRWCAAGAMCKFNDGLTQKECKEINASVTKVANKLGYFSVSVLNDDSDHATVMRLFDILISRHHV